MTCRYGSSMIALAVLALLPGCAALVNGSTQDIAVSTDPPGAHCMMTRENAVIATVPQTPAIVRVNRSPADIVIDCRHGGHAHGRHRMKANADGMTLGNIIGAGLMGMGIDSAINADKAYDSSVTVTMMPQNGPAPDAAGAEPRRMAQAASAAIGDVSQATWIAQRTASANASNQVPTAPVGYVPPPPPPERQPDKPEEAKPAEAKPSEAKPVAAMPATKPAPPKTAAATMKAALSPAGSGPWHAHLASHRTEAAAINEWQELMKKDPKLYGAFEPKIEWIDVKDRGSFARLLLGGWPERKEADAACAKIRGPQRYCAAVKE